MLIRSRTLTGLLFITLAGTSDRRGRAIGLFYSPDGAG